MRSFTTFVFAIGLMCCEQILAASSSVPVYRLVGAQEHFWTTSPTGEGAAKYGFSWEGNVFNVFSPPHSASDRPIYRIGGAVHTFTPYPSERTQLLQAGFRDESILGYVAASPEAGLIPLYLWRKQVGGQPLYFYSVYYSAENAPAVAQGFAYQGVVGYVPTSGQRPAVPYKIGAYYFGMWGPHAVDSRYWRIFDSPNFYLRNTSQPPESSDWWAGVRDLYSGNPFNPSSSLYQSLSTTERSLFESWRTTTDWSYLKPAIGYYDQSQVATVEKHIQQATENGIRYFNFYWYWNNLSHDESLSDGLHSFLKARNRNSMEFMIGICAHGWSISLTDADFDKASSLIVDQYLAQPNYLRIGSQPVIQLCDAAGIRLNASLPKDSSGHPDLTPPAYLNPPQHIDTAALDAFMTMVNNKSYAKFGVRPLWTVRSDDNQEGKAADVITRVEAAQCLLSFSTANIATSAPNTAAMNETLRNNAFPNGQKPIMPCLSENFDQRPRMGVINPSLTTATGNIPGFSDASFQTSLISIKNWMDARVDTDVWARHLTIYAWNEWHEGGIIEPNARDGAKLINMINEVFQLPQGSDPCRTTGNCAGVVGTPPSNPVFTPLVSGTAVIGQFDGVPVVAGQPYVSGWACLEGNVSSVAVHVYVGGAYAAGGSFLKSGVANAKSEPAVGLVCGTNGTAYRYLIPITAAEQAAYVGKTVYVYGISPIGGTNPLFGGSGSYKIPARPSS